MAEVIDLSRQTLVAAFLISAPVLGAAMLVSALISLGQVLTSMQDSTLSTVPRIAAVGAFAFWLAPWMMRRMVMFTVTLLGDFHHLAR